MSMGGYAGVTHGNNAFCPGCGQPFASPEALAEHVRSCPECQVQTARRGKGLTMREMLQVNRITRKYTASEE